MGFWKWHASCKLLHYEGVKKVWPHQIEGVEPKGEIMKQLQKVHEVERTSIEALITQGGRAHRVRSMAGRAVDSMLAVYQERLTFTFVLESEVASIHFDQKRREIFFRGHNISNLKLTAWHLQALERLSRILREDMEGQRFFEDYDATLAKSLADNITKG